MSAGSARQVYRQLVHLTILRWETLSSHRTWFQPQEIQLSSGLESANSKTRSAASLSDKAPTRSTPKETQTITANMPVRIDQTRDKRFATAVDDVVDKRHILWGWG